MAKLDIFWQRKNAVTHESDHHDAVNKREICLKTLLYGISASKFIVERNTGGASYCNVNSIVPEVMVAE